MSLHFLSFCVHTIINSSRTNCLFHSQMYYPVLRTTQAAWESPCPQRCTNLFMEAPTCCVCTWRAEKGCVWVYPSGPRAALENHRDIFVNFLFLACLISFFFSSSPFLFFFFWLSCCSLLIYCMCSRGLGKGGSKTVLLPKGKEAGRHSYFSSGVM